MNTQFERTGPLTDLTSYPQWAQDMVSDCEQAKRSFVGHELWDMISEARANRGTMRAFMMGIWPVIERFPGYMAMSLLKTRYGRSVGDNMARRWLVRNIRVEQTHAEHWLNWAEGAGVPRTDILTVTPPQGTDVLVRWCEEISSGNSLAAAMAATNYAVEGATGEWSQILYESETYAPSLPAATRTKSMRWLQLHAAYDDTHPWEALEIVCTLKGNNPAEDEVKYLGECIKRSYVSMRILADLCVGAAQTAGSREEIAA